MLEGADFWPELPSLSSIGVETDADYANTHHSLRKLRYLMAQSSPRRIASLAKKAALVAERFMRIDACGFHQGQGD